MSRSFTPYRRSLFATVALLVMGVAPLALAQSAPKAKKKGAKPAASASASASASAPASASAAEEAAPSAQPSPEPAPTETTTPPEAGTETAAAAAAEPAADDSSNTLEDPTKTYTFIGLRYRATIIPQFLMNLFVNDGGTVLSNSIGAEIDWRKQGKSTIVWLQYTEYGFGNMLFFQKGQPDLPQNYSIVNSALSGIYAGLDEVWSTPLANHLDFEYGFGLGLGVIFGNLYNDWAWEAAPGTTGAIKASNGNYYAPCNSITDGFIVGGSGGNVSSCNPGLHSNSSVIKVGNYVEPNWFNGGSVPVIFPHIAGQVGLRYKPLKQLEARLDVGIALTGFWIGLSADYGLEKKAEDAGHPAATPPAKEKSPAEDHKESREIGIRDTL